MKLTSKVLGLVLLCSTLSFAQIRGGVPPSVTSAGHGPSFSQGIPASVTSLGPHGFGGGGFGGNSGGMHNGISFSQFPSHRFDFDHDRSHLRRPVVAVPVYVYPYAYPYSYSYPYYE